MRPLTIMLAAVLVSSTGCTHWALEQRTISQASTLSDLNYHQVLDNLAMLSCNQEALPWHLAVNSASIQVTDQGTGVIGAMAKAGTFATWAPTVTAQRGVVNQWGGVPAIDPDSLDLLYLAYRKALDPADPFGYLSSAIFKKIAQIAVQYNIVLAEPTLDKVIASQRGQNKADAWQLLQKNKELHEQLDKVFEQLARLSRPPTDVQVDNYAKKLFEKVDDDTRGQAREKLEAQQQQQRASVTAIRVGVEDQIVKLTRDVAKLPYLPRYPITSRAEHNPHDLEQAQQKIKVLYELVTDPKYAMPWVCRSYCRRDVPACVCQVGHWCRCGSDCHVWVEPDHQRTLREFTLAVLTLAPLSLEETPPAFAPAGVTFSPTLAGH